MEDNAVKITYIAWLRYQRRSDLLARKLGSTIHFIRHGQRGKLLQAPMRYMVQARQTWHILRLEQPDIIFVQNPPIFAALVVSLYTRCYDARYIIDSHTGAFLGLKWSWSVGLHRRLSRGALTTIVHNADQVEVVKRWGCDSLLLADPLGDYPVGEPFQFHGEFNVAVVGSFGADEPVNVVFEAAHHLIDACFYFTGDPGQLDYRLLAKKPKNCILTGYLPDERYIALLRSANCVMVLTTRDHTLLSGANEAVSLGTPLITSDWPILRDYFSQGTVHVPNTVEGVCEGVRQAQREQAKLQQEILLLRQQLEAKWECKYTELLQLLHPS